MGSVRRPCVQILAACFVGAIALAPSAGARPLETQIVADMPTDIALSNATVSENQPVGTAVGTLSTTDPDAGETHTYSLVSGEGASGNAAFRISGTTFETNAIFNYENQSAWSVRIRTDDGNGGVYEEAFTITILDANDPPTNIALSSASVSENQPIGTAVGTLSTTDADAAQTHTYSLVSGSGSYGNPHFRITGTTLETNAVLNYEQRSIWSVRVRTDDGNGGVYEKPFTITILDVNDPPTAVTDTYGGVVGNTKAARGVTVTGQPVVNLTGNLLSANDSDQDGDAVSVVAETVATSGGGTATVNANGSFVFMPGVGDKSMTDTFAYHLTDGVLTSTGTARVGIGSSLVWYIDNGRAVNGDGRSSSPFNRLSNVNGAGGLGDADGSGDFVFLYQRTSAYGGGLRLEAAQKLHGQRHGLTVAGKILVAPGASNPIVTGGVTLAAGNNVQGISLGSAPGAALKGTGVGAAAVGNLTSVAVNHPTGKAVDINGGTLTVVLTSATGTGISLNAVRGTFTANGGALSGGGGAEFSANGGTAAITYRGNIVNSAGLAVDVKNRTGGSLRFTGPITTSGSPGGISLVGNSGSLVNFVGGLTLSTGANRAFVATGGGTVNVVGTANTLSTTTGAALIVQGTTIGSSGLRFRSISVSGDGTRPVTGVYLANTGTLGGLTVSGSSLGSCGGGATSDCTGGTIQGTGTSGAGITLSNTKNASFTRLNLANNKGSGIKAIGANGLTITRSLLDGNGDTTGGTEAGILLTNPAAAVSITGSTVRNSFEDNIRASKSAGSVTVNIANTTIGPNLAASGNNGLTLIGTGTGNVTLNVSGSTFAGNQSAGILSSFTDGSRHTVDVGSSSFTDNNMAVQLATSQDADLTFDVHDNPTILRSRTNAIQILAGAASSVTSLVSGSIRNNAIGDATTDSGARDGMGIAVEVNDDADAVVAITGNTVRHTDQDGIFVQARDPAPSDADTAVGKLDLTLRDNAVTLIDASSPVYGTQVVSRHGTTVCLDIAGNTSTGTGGAERFRVWQRNSSTFKLERLAATTTDPTVVELFLATQNAVGSTAEAGDPDPTVATTYTAVADGTCRTP